MTERERLETILDDFSRVRLMVIGDVMLDEYLWGDVERISPEAPVPVVHVQSESVALGGAGNVVRNVVALGAECSFYGVVGNDAAGEQVSSLFKELGVGTAGLVIEEDRPTTRKTRVVARSQQLVRFDREDHRGISASSVESLFAAVRANVDSAGGTIFGDYDKGTLSHGVIQPSMRLFQEKGIRVFVDPKSELTAYHGADLVKPNVAELESLSHVRIQNRRDLVRAAAALRDLVGGGDIVVTRAAQGITLFSANEPNGIDVGTPSREVFDVQGAGDTAIATLALARLAGASLLQAAVLANAAAGVVLGKIGTATASRDEVRMLLPAAIAAAEGAK